MNKSLIFLALILINVTAIFADVDMRRVEGGTFIMSLDSYDAEYIGGEVQISPFLMAVNEITVDEFSKFVKATKYKTTAEKVGYSFGFKDGNWDYYEGMSWQNPGYEQEGDHPVTCISWYDAISYANWRSKKDGLKPVYKINEKKADPNNYNEADEFKWTVTWNPKANGYRLPTEAEHEYAQRNGGDDMPYPWGDDPAPIVTETLLANIADYQYEEATDDYDSDYYDDDYDSEDDYEDDYYDDYDDDYYYDDDEYEDESDTEYNDDSDSEYDDDYEDDSSFLGYNYGSYDDGYAFTAPVGTYPPNDLGINDLAGNVTEWCWDWYSESYFGDGLAVDPTGLSSGSYHSLRGSSWCDRDEDLYAAYRRSVNTDYLSYNYFGFRLVRNAK